MRTAQVTKGEGLPSGSLSLKIILPWSCSKRVNGKPISANSTKDYNFTF